jgi:hypothetical protein
MRSWRRASPDYWRERPRTRPTSNLIAIIKRTRQYLFVLMTNREPPPTNGSAQAVRPCVIFPKAV